MRHHISDFYDKCADNDTAMHPWHQRREDTQDRQVRSGTDIQRTLFNTPSLYEGCHDYLWVYQQVVLRICNESVVESMCSAIKRHAQPGRGLEFKQMAMEAMIMWSIPAPAHLEEHVIHALY